MPPVGMHSDRETISNMHWNIQRIGIVALVVSVLLAGCAEPAGSLRLEPVNDMQIADHASRSIGGDRDRPADDIVPGAVENGSATVTDQSPPITARLPFAYSGAYYNLSWTTVNTTDAVSISVSTDYTTASADDSHIAYSDLPAADQRIMDELFPLEQWYPDNAAPDDLRFGMSAVYNATEQEASVLYPEQQYDAVIYNGTAYSIQVEEPRQTTLYTYRYTAEQVAPSSTAYAEQLRDRYLFTLSGLSDAERNVVKTAQNDSYYAQNAGDAAFESVLNRFRQQPAVTRGESDGAWLVQYDSTTYWADLSFYRFSDA